DLKGVLRLVRRFSLGRGLLELGSERRAPLADDMGRRLITFALVGVVSTTTSLALFLTLRHPLGSVGAVVVALGATAVGNSWAHRRWTLGRRGRAGLARHAIVSAVIAVCGIGVSALGLVAVDAIGGGLVFELAALAVIWTAATLLRLWNLSKHTV
ncbi:MAG TPA: glycosyltransferase family 2 protein, partial [Acidimicrobiia bacterium]